MNHADHYTRQRITPVVKKANMDWGDLDMLRRIQWHLQEYGYAVSLDELLLFDGRFKSKASLHARLEKLRREGLLDWIDDANRTLHLTEYGREVLG